MFAAHEDELVCRLAFERYLCFSSVDVRTLFGVRTLSVLFQCGRSNVIWRSNVICAFLVWTFERYLAFERGFFLCIVRTPDGTWPNTQVACGPLRNPPSTLQHRLWQLALMIQVFSGRSNVGWRSNVVLKCTSVLAATRHVFSLILSVFQWTFERELAFERWFFALALGYNTFCLSSLVLAWFTWTFERDFFVPSFSNLFPNVPVLHSNVLFVAFEPYFTLEPEMSSFKLYQSTISPKRHRKHC